MYRDHTVAVVVPARDEAAFVGDVIAGVPAFVDRVYLVDDASSDATGAVALAAVGPESDRPPASEHGASGVGDAAVTGRALADRVAETTRRGRVVALRHDENRGAGGAVKTGYLAALAGDADLVATIDGDGQTDPTCLDRFLAPLVSGDAAYAKGTRLRRREDRDGMPAVRLVGNVLLTLLCRVSSGYLALSDPVNGYTAISQDALAAIDPGTIYEGYGYGIDVLARLHAAGCRVVEVPHASAYGAETSGIDYTAYATRVSGLLVATLAWRLRREQPGDRPERAATVDLVGHAVGTVVGTARTLVGAVSGIVLGRGQEP